MPIDFPNSPSVDSTFTSGNTTWRWSGTAWKVVRNFAPTGATGQTGPTGVTGATGVTGVTGVTGINWRAAFDFVEYNVRDVVQYNGSTYFCNTFIASGDAISHIPGSSARWDLLSGKGATGTTGDDGQFSVAATTPPASPEVGDAWYDSASGNLYVYYDGYWVEAASANDGPTGNTGATGATGQTGPTGATGMAFAQTTEPADPVDGLIWVDTDGAVVGQQMVRWSKAPTVGTTALTGVDDGSTTLSYTVGYEQVYRNGTLLSRGNDYTATTGTSITLIDATLTGDIIEVFASAVLAVADVYTQAQVDTKIATPVLISPEERTTVSATAAATTVNFDADTQGVLYYTSNASANWTLNIRGSSSTTLASKLSVGDSVTVSFLVTNGSTAYYQTAFNIDGSVVTPKYSGGTAPASGNASSIDVYTYTIIKTAATPTYTVFGAGPIKYA